MSTGETHRAAVHEADALEIAEQALQAADGDEVEVLVSAERSGLARFAASEVHQPTLIENLVVMLRVCRNGKVGTAATNRTDEEGLKAAAARAGEAAASAPPEPDFPGFARPTELPAVEGYDDEVAALGPEDQARLARAAIEGSPDLEVYGFFTSAVSELAVLSTTGVEAHQRMTDAVTLVVAAGDGRSGYAEQSGWTADAVDPAAVARQAAEKAARTGGARTVEPAAYRAVLEPYAVAELVQYFAYDSFGALGLLEERSYLAGRLGERVFDEKVSIADDALDARGLPKAFDFEGSPKRRVELIEGGVARGVVWDRRSSTRAGNGAETTGHAPPPSLREYGPLPFALSFEGGTADSVDDLVQLVDDGIYITRLHYLSIVDPREGVITGMTRDGTFRIRDGGVDEPLVNLRFTVAVPEVLGDVPGLSRAVTLVNGSDFYGDRYPVGVIAPTLATAHFNITGTGSSPGL